MKKIVFVFVLALLSITLKAQVIADLDEVSLMGTWTANYYEGLWSNLDYRFPQKIEFNDTKDSYIYVRNNSSTEPLQLTFNGYWIGGTTTGKYTLHFICERDYENTYTGLSMVNFVITNFNGNNMTLTTYDGNGMAKFTKTTSGISNIIKESKSDSRMYSLSGIEISNPQGVYIQNGKTRISKK